MINVQGYTSAELADRWGVNRQRISALARRHNWQVVAKIGRANVYDIEDVDEYQHHRWRTQLQRHLGDRLRKPGQGLFTDDTYDLDCPVCESFAVYRKPETAEDEVEWLSGRRTNKWRCIKGHHGED